LDVNEVLDTFKCSPDVYDSYTKYKVLNWSIS